MGIPSYYKKWVDTCPGLVQLLHPSVKVDWLFMDFNCLIYQCIQQPSMPVYQVDQEAEWEEELLNHVEQYTKKVIQYVQPVKGVYLAVDGVVPMAKMRQQRLRRFKSQWMAKKDGGCKWDTNAITPGTPFMEKLHKRLELIRNRSSLSQFIVSNSNEPGEGEHKVMHFWRSHPETHSSVVAVYGLDADLIILSLLSRLQLQHTSPIWLFREQMEKGKGVHDPFTGEECFEWFGIHVLQEWLRQRLCSDSALFSYCFAMSVLGNDFLPRSLHLTLREDGHEELLCTLQQTGPLVDEDLQIQPGYLLLFFQLLAMNEDDRMNRYLMRRKRMVQIYSNTETGLGESNWPCAQFEEKHLLLRGRSLHPQWRERYLDFFSFTEEPELYIETLCREYLYGIQWIWAYYLGKSDEIDYDWYYPASLPPLWSWLAQHSDLPEFPGTVHVRVDQIRPQEQLCVVLPLSSWHFIRDPILRQFPQQMPYYFPDAFEFDALGKRFFWECEPILPIPSIREIHTMITSFEDTPQETHNTRLPPLSPPYSHVVKHQ